MGGDAYGADDRKTGGNRRIKGTGLDGVGQIDE